VSGSRDDPAARWLLELTEADAGLRAAIDLMSAADTREELASIRSRHTPPGSYAATIQLWHKMQGRG
jgi:hypothetical protein